MNINEIKQIAKNAAEEALNNRSHIVRRPIHALDTAEGHNMDREKTKEPGHEWESLGYFFKDIVRVSQVGGYETSELRDWSQKTAGYMEEGDLSQGGYLVPEEFRSVILQTALEKSIVKSRATVLPMTTNRLTIPALVDDDHATDFFGGITISRTAEKGGKSAKNPVFGKVGLTLNKLTGLCYVTDELLEDSPLTIEPLLKATFGQAIAFTQDCDFLRGNGSNEALGAFHASNPSLIQVTKETGQVADTIVFENIINMWARMYPAGHDKAVWVANIDCFPQLAKMSMAVGTGGIPVWSPANAAGGSPFSTLMGRPLIFTEKMATVGENFDIGLADFSQYLVGERAGGTKFASSIHVAFANDETAFRFVMRYDGQPWWLSTLTPKAGSELSPFIYLQERA